MSEYRSSLLNLHISFTKVALMSVNCLFLHTMIPLKAFFSSFFQVSLVKHAFIVQFPQLSHILFHFCQNSNWSLDFFFKKRKYSSYDCEGLLMLILAMYRSVRQEWLIKVRQAFFWWMLWRDCCFCPTMLMLRKSSENQHRLRSGNVFFRGGCVDLPWMQDYCEKNHLSTCQQTERRSTDSREISGTMRMLLQVALPFITFKW